MGIFNSKNKTTRTEGGKTIIAQGCKITGEIVDLKGALHVDGHVEGVVETEFDVSVGQEGHVSGLIKAHNIVVSGVLDGKIICQSIDVLSTGKLLGEVISNEMKIETGGRFIGESRELAEGGVIVSTYVEDAHLEHHDDVVKELDKPNDKTEETIAVSTAESKG